MVLVSMSISLSEIPVISRFLQITSYGIPPRRLTLPFEAIPYSPFSISLSGLFLLLFALSINRSLDACNKQ